MDHDGARRGLRIRPAWLVIGGVGVAAAIALGVPLASLLYVGVLLICPLLMMKMHGAGHDREDHAGHASAPQASAAPGSRARGDSPEEGGDG